METTRNVRTDSGGNLNTRVCDVCGNAYDKWFEVQMNGETHVFDSFECAIHLLAPRCDHCGCQIIGHGMEQDGAFYCCAHCASQHGVHMKDRAADEKSHA